MMSKTLIVCCLLTLSMNGAAHAATLVGLTTGNALIRFDSATPGTIIAGPVAITGLSGGENIVAVDYRPATAALYGLSDMNRLYTINASTGAATLVGTQNVALSGTEFGFDVNPVPDRIRVVSDADQNIRVNPDTALLAAVDTALNFNGLDVNAGQNPNIVGSAYTNSFPGSTATTLYGIDSNFDILVTQNPPNGGTLNTVGLLGVDTSSVVGFDIEPPSNTAFAALTVGGSSQLHVINLTTGGATLVGSIGGGHQLRGLAVVPFASALIGLTTGNALIRFDANAPGTLIGSAMPIAGLDAGESIVGIDYRPATGLLYGLSNLNRLFRLDTATGVATLVIVAQTTLAGSKFGVDFNPVADRLRVVSNTGQNMRINVETGAVFTDTTLAFDTGDPNAGIAPVIAETAYTNSFAGAVSTALYSIDSGLDVLVRHINPNGGLLTTVGALGVTPSGNIGLEIEPSLNAAFAAMEVGGTSGLYRINLTTGAATLIGSIGGGHHLIGLAAVLFGASAPVTVTATATAATQITITWSAVIGAGHYEVYRRGPGGGFTSVASASALQLIDPTAAAGTAYLYKVSAVGPSGLRAPDSNVDLATAIVFTDSTLFATTTLVKAVHLTELRDGINAVRQLAGVGAVSFTDANPAGVIVAATHVTELRAALDPARALLGLSAAVYSRALETGSSLISAIDFTELRNGVK
jgi:hypothetical protein